MIPNPWSWRSTRERAPPILRIFFRDRRRLFKETCNGKKTRNSQKNTHTNLRTKPYDHTKKAHNRKTIFNNCKRILSTGKLPNRRERSKSRHFSQV